MNSFGRSSRAQLATCDARLQTIAHRVLRIKDHSIIKGHRPKIEQNAAFASGASKLQWPNGKHNKNPSLAIDIQTYPRPDGEQELREEQFYLLGLYRGVGSATGVTIRTGADWDRDGEVSDNGWDDLFHVEIDEEPDEVQADPRLVEVLREIT